MNNLVSLANQLDTTLCFDKASAPPRLYRVPGESSTLPGQPRIGLDRSDLNEYLQREHLTPDLDLLAPNLWLASFTTIRQKFTRAHS